MLAIEEEEEEEEGFQATLFGFTEICLKLGQTINKLI